MSITSEQAADLIVDLTPTVTKAINGFAEKVLRTKGGREESGMGTLFEALWCFYMNGALEEKFQGKPPCYIAWMVKNEYNDFAVVNADVDWDIDTMAGELLRIEAKSTISSAGEPKAHFDRLIGQITDTDLLLVLVWQWQGPEKAIRHPEITAEFLGPAKPIAFLRDAMHRARGGTFVGESGCPYAMDPVTREFYGQPLNCEGARELRFGPGSMAPRLNFGGLRRMLGSSTSEAKAKLNDQFTFLRCLLIPLNAGCTFAEQICWECV